MDPTLEDYLQPETVQNLNLTATHDKILITWSYPEKAKTKIESFMLERENNGEKKVLGYYDKNTTSLEDKDFQFEKTYKYRIFAIRPKGIYSRPTEAMIKPQKLPEIEKIQYKITPQGVMLLWDTQNALNYNLYRVNPRGDRVKIGSTDKNNFSDELLHPTILAFTTPSKPELSYVITTYIIAESTFMESKGTHITIPLDSFIPSKPQEVFWSINEQGVYISWKEVSERWSKGYKIYRKIAGEKEFKPIGETMIPLFFDADYNISNIKGIIYYKITTIGPLRESEEVEIRVEVHFG
ncbi:MAG: fibronectin type III domain-containing protein [Thermodesulfovibrio sp.]|nr:fibronectin type III domain-containing protein [Thermodesulfovibrio sp.]